MNGEKTKSSHHEYGRHYESVGTVTIPKEVFESFYPRSSHHQQPRVHLRHIFGNAFPMWVVHSIYLYNLPNFEP